MDEAKRNLKGSEKRDEFKMCHKKLNKRFYATDADLCLISKKPPGTVAYLDYKGSNEGVTFSEAIQYNEWMKQAPMYIVEGEDPTNGPFVIKRYLGTNWKPEPPEVNYGEEFAIEDWRAFESWEAKLRQLYRQRGGWKGHLKGT